MVPGWTEREVRIAARRRRDLLEDLARDARMHFAPPASHSDWRAGISIPTAPGPPATRLPSIRWLVRIRDVYKERTSRDRPDLLFPPA